MSASFAPGAVEALAAAYPERPARLSHGLAGHRLLRLGALETLATRMRPEDVLCFRGDVPVGVGPQGAPRSDLPVAETLRAIERCGSWMVLKSVEQDPDYRRLLHDLLAELETVVRPATGPMLRREAFIFVSSPKAVTPFHFDPEHNVLLHLEGEKLITVFPVGDAEIAPGEAHEQFHLNGQYNLPWCDEFEAKGTGFALRPGDALYVPVKAPHWVRNGDAPAISLSITWRSGWSWREQQAHGLNRLLRRAGLNPAPPARYPGQNYAKSLAFRLVDKTERLLKDSF
ncbi:MAG: JmjC domain-containing protein [Sphingomonadaceae bacterium]